jgi:hypothetical protein
MNDNHVRRSERGERVNREDIKSGDTVVMDWNPYDWWLAAHNPRETRVTGRMTVTVETAAADDIAGDMVVRTPDGLLLRDYGGGRRYVAGPSGGVGDMPERTDVGTGAHYYTGGSDE